MARGEEYWFARLLVVALRSDLCRLALGQAGADRTADGWHRHFFLYDDNWLSKMYPLVNKTSYSTWNIHQS